MSKRILRSSQQACQLCDFAATRQLSIRPFLRAPKSTRSSREFCTSKRLYLQNARPLAARPIITSKGSSTTTKTTHSSTEVTHATEAQLKEALHLAKTACNDLLALEIVLSEKEITYALWRCEALANLILDFESPDPKNESAAVSALLELDETTTPTARKTPLPKFPPNLLHIIDELSDLAYLVIKHPPVFISPKALELYVSTQSSLRRPQTLPEAFHLYANKPLPKENTSPIKYHAQNPNKVGNAIPIPVAEKALQSAITARQLTTVMDIIETSYATTAFQRAKFVRRGLLPVTGVAVAPLAAYTIASQAALLQTTMDTDMATKVAFTGLLAYMGFTATIGVVALTTANDQMDRVTWSQGMPLKERWIREEERAAIDRVAQSWGFRESWRRGEEEGVDWDALREWTGRRGMILDAVELMEGME